MPKAQTRPESQPWDTSYPSDIKWNMDVETAPVYSMLDDTAAKFGDRPAFDFLGKKWTWSEINTLSKKMARGLQRLGAKKGMKIGIMLPNTPYFLISFYAIARTGATAVNFNPLYSEREIAYQIEDSETDLMITLDLGMMYHKLEKMLHSTRLNQIVVCPFTDALPFPKNVLFKSLKGKEIARIPNNDRHLFYDTLIDNEGKLDPVEINVEEDVALFQYTGGTTGVPKAAQLTHANLTANTDQVSKWLLNARAGEDKMLGVLPFFHVFAMTVVLNLSVKMGFEIIATPRFDLEDTLKIIDKKKPDHFPAVPAIYSAINNHPKRTQYDLTSLRTCVSGGAPLPVEVKKNFEKKTGCVVVEGYGLSETSPVLCVNPIKGDNRPGSIGLPFPQTEIELHNPDTGKKVKDGERGELCAKGPQVMKGYWNKPKANKETFDNGWLKTGDIATMDEDGYFYIVDRIKDMIITNGYNVYPRNVEEAIYLHPSVEECIVAGLPDKKRGEIVKAWIKLKEGRQLSEEDLKLFLEDKISPMEFPKLVEFRESPLPKTMIGKLSRKDIIAAEKKIDKRQ